MPAMNSRKSLLCVLGASLALAAACGTGPREPAAPDPDTVETAATATRQAAARRAEEQVGARNEAAWNRALTSPANQNLLAQALAHEKWILGQADYLAAPRFTQTLVLSSESTLRQTRAELLADIAGRLAGLRHVRREPSSPGAIDDVPETLGACAAKLTRCDLLNLQLLLDFLSPPATRTQILRMGAADRADTSSEHGGVVAVAGGGGRLVLREMPPMFGGNDLAYVASDETMALVPTSLALFHLHFATVDSAENAGPGVGDLVFARANRVSCVVFTSLDARSFDADYYNPQGAVVDLGVYHEGD